VGRCCQWKSLLSLEEIRRSIGRVTTSTKINSSIKIASLPQTIEIIIFRH
jgi:hypothetical protein